MPSWWALAFHTKTSSPWIFVCSGWGPRRLQHCEQHWGPDLWRHTGARAWISHTGTRAWNPHTGNQTSSLTSGLKQNHSHWLETSHYTVHLMNWKYGFLTLGLDSSWKPEEFCQIGPKTVFFFLQWSLASSSGEHVHSIRNQINSNFWKPNKSTTILPNTGCSFTKECQVTPQTYRLEMLEFPPHCFWYGNHPITSTCSL